MTSTIYEFIKSHPLPETPFGSFGGVRIPKENITRTALTEQDYYYPLVYSKKEGYVVIGYYYYNVKGWCICCADGYDSNGECICSFGTPVYVQGEAYTVMDHFEEASEVCAKSRNKKH